MRAALYGRKSQENEENVKDQIENARAFCLSRGWSVAAEYVDDGISGAEFNDRPGFTAMTIAAKSKKHPFDVIVTMNVDRFGREAFRTNIALLEVAEAGVRIYTYADGQEVKLDTPIAKQMLSMRNYAAEDFRAQIAEKTREKLISRARAGWATGTRTFGYDLVKVDKHVERRVNETERAIVQRVFEMAAEGIGNRRIAQTLRAESVAAPGRKGWSKSVLKTLFSNRLYIGTIVFGKSKAAASGGSAKKRALASPDNWIEVPAPTLRIINDALWRKVQARREQTRKHYMRAPDGKLLGKPESGLLSTHLLSGFIRCGHCGGSMGFARKNARTLSYYCMGRGNGSGCTNGRGVREADLDRAVVNALHELLSDEDTVWTLLTARADRWRAEQEAKNRADERPAIEREVEHLEAAVARLTDAIEAGQPVGDRLRQRTAERTPYARSWPSL